MIRLLHILVLCAAVALLLVPAAAQAASPREIIEDCSDDGRFGKKYSNKDLRRARDKLPGDADQYNDCKELIAAGIDNDPKAGAAGKRGGDAGGAGTGGRALTPPEQQAAAAEDNAALNEATSGSRKPRVQIGGSSVEPGKNGLFGLASAANEMPLSLGLVLLALALLGTGGVLFALRRRIPALAGIRLPRLSRVPLPRLRR